jgi:hypothetical protein
MKMVFLVINDLTERLVMVTDNHKRSLQSLIEMQRKRGLTCLLELRQVFRNRVCDSLLLDSYSL